MRGNRELKGKLEKDHYKHATEFFKNDLSKTSKDFVKKQFTEFDNFRIKMIEILEEKQSKGVDISSDKNLEGGSLEDIKSFTLERNHEIIDMAYEDVMKENGKDGSWKKAAY